MFLLKNTKFLSSYRGLLLGAVSDKKFLFIAKQSQFTIAMHSDYYVVDNLTIH